MHGKALSDSDSYVGLLYARAFLIDLIIIVGCLGTRRVRANQVYQDYISDMHHTHMNATQVSSNPTHCY